jgi:hypothetical protein
MMRQFPTRGITYQSNGKHMLYMSEYSAGSKYYRTNNLTAILHLVSIIAMLLLLLACDKIHLKHVTIITVIFYCAFPFLREVISNDYFPWHRVVTTRYYPFHMSAALPLFFNFFHSSQRGPQIQINKYEPTTRSA